MNRILKTWLSIIIDYFDRIVASNSERASKERDARGMALSGGGQRAIEPPPPAVGKGLKPPGGKGLTNTVLFFN